MTDRHERYFLATAALGLLLLGIALRLWHIASTPLWLDEAYSAYAADHGFAFLWHVVPRYETHPPAYYSLLRVWTLVFGDGLVALRALGLAAGIATLPVLAGAGASAGRLIGRGRDMRRGIALAALAFGCVAIAPVEMAREVRPYPLMILAYALALIALLRLAERSAAGGPLVGRTYLAYLVLVESLLWLHNLGVLFAAALGIALLAAVVRRQMTRADWAWLVAGHALVALAWLPALLILRDQAPTWISSTWLRFVWDTVPARLAVLYAVPGWQGIAALVLIALALTRLERTAPRLAAMLVAMAVVPVALSLMISATIAPVFILRTMTPVAVPTILLLAIGAVGWHDARRWIALGAALILWVNLLAVDLQARAGGPPQDWYGTVGWLAKRFRPGDQIVAYPNEGALPLAYALRDKGLAYPIRPIPAPVPAFEEAGGWYPTGSRGVVSLPPPRLHAIAAEPATRAVPTIWLLRLGAGTYDPGDVLLRELHRGRYIVRRWRAGPIDIIGLRRGLPPPTPARNRR